MKLNKLASALSAAGLGVAIALAAAPTSAQVPTFYTPITKFHDDDLDRVFDNNSNGVLDAGDRLVSVFEFHDSEGIFAGQGPSAFEPGFELTGIADITIASVDATTGVITFRATTAGEGSLLAGLGAGTTIAEWIDPTPDLDVINSNCGTRAQCITLASNGNLFATFGFFGDADNYWVSAPASGGANIGTVQTGSSSTSFGTFNFGQDIGTNNTGRTFGTLPCTPFCTAGGDGFVTSLGNGQILGGQGLIATEWTARSKADQQLSPIPEPGSLALLGVALAGAAGFVRRRMQA